MSTTTSLAEALAAFQAEVPTFSKTNTAKVKMKNGGEYSYKYADLADILLVVSPLLAKHGLSWSSKPARAEDGSLVLRYRLLHASGEADGDEMPLRVDADCKPQELGSAITYMRRYAITAHLNLATEEDDDGRSAQHADRTARPAPKPAPPKPKEESVAPEEQRKYLSNLADELTLSATDLADAICAAAGQPTKTFDSLDKAYEWCERALERLPAKLVENVEKRLRAMAGKVAG